MIKLTSESKRSFRDQKQHLIEYCFESLKRKEQIKTTN